jgi:hypothetical protein
MTHELVCVSFSTHFIRHPWPTDVSTVLGLTDISLPKQNHVIVTEAWSNALPYFTD